MPRTRHVKDREVNIDNLIKMSWAGNLASFSSFLNMKPDTHVISYDKTREYRKFVTLADSLEFSRGMSSTLEAIVSDRPFKDAAALMCLDRALNGSRIDVAIDHSRHVPVFAGPNLLQSLWLKFVFEVLAPGFSERLIRCPGCLRWVSKRRANQVFCCSACKHFYYRWGR